MKTQTLSMSLLLATTLWGCGSSEFEKAKQEAEIVQPDSAISSSAAMDAVIADSGRKFIRTASIRFKVKNTVNATYNIENVIRRAGGFVTHTNLKSEVSYTYKIPVSADSSVEVSQYTVSNKIAFRVPNHMLDSALQMISNEVEFLDYRTIDAEDVALRMFANKLNAKRSGQSARRMEHIADKGKEKKLINVALTEDIITDKQEKADQSLIENLGLNDKVNYSTVEMEIYQSPVLRRTIMENEQEIKPYEPGFLLRMAESVKSGWIIVEEILIGIVRMWGVILLVGIAVIIFRKTRLYRRPIKT